ncbi:MAG: TonB-dependent receptor plug domain-containing protein, partial [Bacteroidia bacterium]|nr:TonB-dependent receptor plug domain-containing protein [Bacteroidia bacterium]
RFKQKRSTSGKIITKISASELEEYSGQSIANILGRTVGVEINGARSNAGQNLSYFIRGGRNRQVLILIDGIQVTDPSQIGNDYDLRLLNADQVESIEILKGAASTLYGTGAATAVINIKLKDPENKPVQLQLKSVLGTNSASSEQNSTINDFRNSIALNGTLGEITYLASFGHQFTDGLSAIQSGKETDVFNSYNGNFKLGYDLSSKFKLTSYFSFDRFKADFDDSFAMMDAANRLLTNQHRLGLTSQYSYKKGSFNLNAALNNVEREVESNFPTLFKSNSLVVDVYNRYNVTDNFYLLTGLNIQDNQMESFSIPFGESDFNQDIDPENAQFTIADVYLNSVLTTDIGIQLNAGLRLNNHSEYGSHLVYSINPSYVKETNFGYVKGIVSLSTAYITPSLYQLFEPTFGNPDLQPEENQTIEIGSEVSLKNNTRFSLVYFTRNEDQFIDFKDTGNFVFQYQNVSESFKASGLEFTAQTDLSDKLKINVNATYTKLEEELNLRIPEFKVNSSINYRPFTGTNLNIAYQYNAERRDVFFNNNTFESESVVLKPFGLLDLFVSHNFKNSPLSCFASLTNLLNKDFEELNGFTTRGRNVSIGFGLKL